jgi:hypothetical protein
VFGGRDDHQIFSSKAAGADHVHSHAAKQRVYVGKDAEQGLLFVGCPKKKPMVVVFDAISGKKIASLVIPAGIDDLHFDPKSGRLYASCSESALIVIEKVAGEYKLWRKIPPPKILGLVSGLRE